MIIKTKMKVKIEVKMKTKVKTKMKMDVKIAKETTGSLVQRQQKTVVGV